MLDRVSIPVADLDRAARFYDAVLATIGLRRRKERTGAIGYGPETRAAPVFWLLGRRFKIEAVCRAALEPTAAA